MSRRIVSCLIAFLLIGLFSHRALAEDKSPWVEIRSPHFTIYTDAGEKRGRDIALRFEQMRTMFGALTGQRELRTASGLQIVAFRSEKELKQVLPRSAEEDIGITFSSPSGVCIAFDIGTEDSWVVGLHEFGHMLLHTNFPPTQLWFDEGFAQYFSTIKLNGKDVEIGAEPDAVGIGTLLKNTSWSGVLKLFAVTHESSTYHEGGWAEGQFYADSWVTVHYLFDNHKMQQASQYFSLVREQNVPIPQAIQQAFGMTPKDFDTELRDYMQGRKFKMFKAAAPENINEASFTVRGVDEWGAKAVIARMHSFSDQYRDQSIAEFQGILQHDPKSAEALFGLGFVYVEKDDLGKADEYVSKALAADGSNPNAHYWKAVLLMAKKPSSADGWSELQKEAELAVKINPTPPDAYYLLGMAQLNLDQLMPAYQSMQSALAMDPNDEDFSLGLAEVYLRGNRNDAAMPLLTKLAQSSNARVAAEAKRLQKQAAEPAPKPAATPTGSGQN